MKLNKLCTVLLLALGSKILAQPTSRTVADRAEGHQRKLEAYAGKGVMFDQNGEVIPRDKKGAQQNVPKKAKRTRAPRHNS